MKNKFFHKLAKAVKAILSLRIVLRRASFEVTILISILIHVLLFGWISTSKNFADDEELPVKARVNVRYEPPISSPPLPKKPALYQSDLSNFSMVKLQPMVQKLPMLKPKLHNLVPKKPVLKKPALKNTLKKTTLLKPTLTKTEAPRLKISQPQITPTAPTIKQIRTPKPQAFRTPKKPLLLPPNSPERTRTINNLPKFIKDPVPFSPITSRKSVFKPSQIEFPKFSQEEISPKKLNRPKFSNPFDLPLRKLPQLMQPPFGDIPTISPVQPADKPETRLDELFPDEVKLEEPLQALGIPAQAAPDKTGGIPATSYLQRKKIAQLAGEEYNLHIRTQITPKLGSYPYELFVLIRLKIAPSGKIIDYEFIKKSGFSSFDQAAELAVRNANLDPLPKALTENPPYIVPVRIKSPIQ